MFNVSDVKTQFLKACLQAGLIVDDVEMNGRKIRCRVQGDKAGQKSGFYKGYSDGYPNGIIGNYKTGGCAGNDKGIADQAVFKWKYEPSAEDKRNYALKVNSNNPVDRQNYISQIEQLKKESEAKAAENERLHQIFLSRKAQESFVEFNRVCQPASAHAYLKHKQVNAYGVFVATQPLKIKKELEKDLTKQFQHLPKGALVIPSYSLMGEFQSYQFIYQLKDTFIKSFRSEAPKSGSVFILGGGIAQAEVILLCEGYATGATLHHCTGQTTLVCFDIENLCVIARELRALYPHKTIYICSDNDHLKPRELDHQGKPKINVGLTKGMVIADEIHSHLLSPIFSRNQNASDWNDLYSIAGRQGVRDQLKQQLVFIRQNGVSVFAKQHDLLSS
ncbi:hypothetical protein BKE30_13450 [Alkanindiges hydrocarboniclasticus]|uniref:Toprim domain-containing protein n=1 Tax=Alkanindiges hydrocarboniclasticus TaxID=1907941 RepID=A0A1S8CR24_9GAMM|nr:toprim domain-containing protein [Alkanindiges hydrocarboniclasticus]ONG37951.1 hypothetical protein BKE30_13450 [Alkanindiges hydrocarboniclasticus]